MRKYFPDIDLFIGKELLSFIPIRYYSEGPHAFQISFTNFLIFALPIGIVMLINCWLWLQFVYNRQE